MDHERMPIESPSLPSPLAGGEPSTMPEPARAALDDFAPQSDIDGTFAEAKARALERFERAYLEALVQRCNGNLSEAARRADLARNHLRALLKKLGLYNAPPKRPVD